MDAFDALTGQLHRAAGEGDPGDRAAALTDLRERIASVLGECDRLLAGAHQAREAAGSSGLRRRMAARSVADGREGLVAEGADPAALSEAAAPSHGELDALEEEGLLDAAAAEVVRENG